MSLFSFPSAIALIIIAHHWRWPLEGQRKMSHTEDELDVDGTRRAGWKLELKTAVSAISKATSQHLSDGLNSSLRHSRSLGATHQVLA